VACRAELDVRIKRERVGGKRSCKLNWEGKVGRNEMNSFVNVTQTSLVL
jgi:hypothetical protein